MGKKRHNLESKLMIVKYVLEEHHSIWEAAEFFWSGIPNNQNMG